MTLLTLIEKEFESRGMVKVPFLIERLAVSTSCHVMNMSNLDKKRFFHAGSLENFRIHVIVVAPSGFGKTIPFKFFLSNRGLLSKTGINTSVRGTFSRESWMGTVYSNKSDKKGTEFKTTKGIFNRYKQGIVGADEFMRLVTLCAGEGIDHDEVYLMTALDGDTATKDLSYGSVEEKDIGTTIWGGMRIAPINTASGFARRWMFQVFFPTPQIARDFKSAGRSKKIRTPISDITKEQIFGEIKEMRNIIDDTTQIDYTSLEKVLNGTMAIPHFEESIYKRIALGYALANGTFPDIIMDDRLTNLIVDEHWSRDIIRAHPEKEMMYQIIKEESGHITKGELYAFIKRYYQLPIWTIDIAWRALRADELFEQDKNNVLTVRPKKVVSTYTFNVKKGK